MQSPHQLHSWEWGHGPKLFPGFISTAGGADSGLVSPHPPHCCSLREGMLIHRLSCYQLQLLEVWFWCLPQGGLPMGWLVLDTFGSLKGWDLSSALGGLISLLTVVPSVRGNCACNKPLLSHAPGSFQGYSATYARVSLCVITTHQAGL